MSRLVVLSLLLLAFHVGFAKPAHSAVYGYTDLRFTPAMTCIQFNDPAKALSFSFVTPADRNGKMLSYVEFFVQSVVSPGFPLVVDLRSDTSGLPGDLLTQGSGTPGGISAFSWFKINLSPRISLSAGQRYHVVIHPADGYGSPAQYINVGLQIGKYRTDMNAMLDMGQGWFSAPNSDPTLVLGFTDGVEWGQPYSDRLSSCSIYGSSTNSRYGERFQLASPMTVSKVSFVLRRRGWPVADLRVSFFDESTGSFVADEKFCSASDVSYWDSTWASRVLASPVALKTDRSYRLCLYQEGQQGDANNCYVAHYQYSGSGAATFGGLGCRYFGWDMSTGYLLNFWNHDMYFRLDTGGIDVQRINSFRVTSSECTVVIETNKVTEATLEYGPTTNYGSSRTSQASTVHTFLLSGLSPATVYHYRFSLSDPADAADTHLTQDCKFRTDPSEQKIDVTVFGDTQSLDSNSFFGLMAQYPHDIIVTTGDDVDLHDIPDSEVNFERACNEWKWLLRDMTPVARNATLYTCLGNHDSYYYANPFPLQGYNATALMPTNGSGDGRYYSFDYGPAHFCILDAHEVDGSTVGPAQMAWATQDLLASNKTLKVVALHQPVYGLAADEANQYRVHNWTALHDMFRQTGVQLVLTGHRHVYNRYYKDGICYIITGLPNWLRYSDETWEQGWTGMPSKPNSGGEPGTIPAYINKPGWLQLQITSAGFSGAYINLLGQALDTFGGFTPDPSVPPPMSIGQAKHRGINALVDITGIVTATGNDWTQRIYVQENDSRAGIRVTLDVPAVLERGDRVHITGSLVVDSNELKVAGELVSAPVTNMGPPSPIAVNSTNIGSGPVGSWQGTYGGKGLGSTGSLVRMIGVVKNVDSQHGAFYLSDSSNAVADNNLKGAVRVECGAGATLPQEGSWYAVTGISSCEKIANKVYAILRPRDAADLEPIN